MLGSILIGLDEPTHCASLMDLGIRWAQQSAATIVGLGIVDEPGVRAIEPAFPVGGKPGVDPVYHKGYEAKLDEIERQVGQLLEQFAARCAEAGVKYEKAKRSGSPVQIIEEQAQACDLILLSQRPRFRFKARDNDDFDIFREILKNAPRPITIVPVAAAAAGPVLIAYDESLQATRTLAAFVATGLCPASQTHVISVAADRGDATRAAGRAEVFLQEHEIKAVLHVVQSTEPPANAILEHVRSLGTGLLVMGAYGQPVLREFFIGSVTRTILKKSPVPVFCFH